MAVLDRPEVDIDFIQAFGDGFLNNRRDGITK